MYPIPPAPTSPRKFYASEVARLTTLYSTVTCAFDGSHIWLAANNGQIRRVRASDGEEAWTVTVDTSPLSMVYDGLRMWIACYGTSTMYVLNAADGSTAASFALNSSPEGIDFDGRYVWVTHNDPLVNNVMKIDALSLSVIGAAAVGQAPSGVACDGYGYVWTANFNNPPVVGGNTVSKVRASDLTVVATYTAAANPVNLMVDHYRDHIWVSYGGGSQVSRRRLSDGVETALITVGSEPRGMTTDGRRLWVANAGPSSVTCIDLDTLDIIGTYTVPGKPRSLAWDGTYVWVTNATGTEVSKL